jgi:hypothetical protein
MNAGFDNIDNLKLLILKTHKCTTSDYIFQNALQIYSDYYKIFSSKD